jgi:glycosyltransferase involved in cell wall biosynthesis
MKSQKQIINLVQDLATPHNNVLIAAFKDCNEAQIKLWYARDMDQSRYQWSTNISHEHFPAEIYGTSLNWRFIKYCLSHPEEKFVIVGWMNANTRLIHLLFFLLRRPFNHWTDLPDPKAQGMSLKQNFLRWSAYKLLKHAHSKVFGVGATTLICFRGWGFSAKQLVNLPIFVAVDEDLPAYHAKRSQLLEQYAINQQGFLISAGSRLIQEKGYDLLIKAIGLLDAVIRQHIKVVIVGSGDCLSELEQLVIDLNLSGQIVMEKWLAIDDFKALIANSDVFIHPSRFDSYGGTTLGMALGVPVIGSNGAGAAFDRIKQGRNGFLYDAEDIQALANFITLLYQNPELKRRMGVEAYKTACQWPSRRGVDIILNNAI